MEWHQLGGELTTTTGKPREIMMRHVITMPTHLIILKRHGGGDDVKTGIPRLVAAQGKKRGETKKRAVDIVRYYDPHGTIVWDTGKRESVAR